MSEGVVIVGAGHAGTTAAATLRQLGFDAPIKLLSAEATLPYHRPPLSKAWLAGEKSAEQIQLRNENFYQINAIELINSCSVTAIDTHNKRLECAASLLRYDKLILATGCQARPLAGLDEYTNVLSLRNLADARRLQEQLGQAHHLTLIGGGFVGLEVAATARKRGIAVDVIEAESGLLKRVLPDLVADFFLQKHRTEGVNLHLNTVAKSFQAKENRLCSITLSNQHTLYTDLVLVCIGDSPAVDLAGAAHLRTELAAIYVDPQLRTSCDHIYAIGDCTSFHLPLSGQLTRLPSVQNAVDQGKAVAQSLVGKGTGYDPVPWFWSDQYNIKLQIAGVSTDNTTLLLRGSPSDEKFSVLEHIQGRLMAVYSINSAADHLAARTLIKNKLPLDVNLAADSSVALKDCA